MIPRPLLASAVASKIKTAHFFRGSGSFFGTTFEACVDTKVDDGNGDGNVDDVLEMERFWGDCINAVVAAAVVEGEKKSFQHTACNALSTTDAIAVPWVYENTL